MRYGKNVDNPTDAKKVCGSILYMDGLVSCGCLQTRPSSASGAGISAVSVPYLQHLGQEGMETAFFNSSGLPGPFLKRQTGHSTALAQEGAIGISEHQQ